MGAVAILDLMGALPHQTRRTHAPPAARGPLYRPAAPSDRSNPRSVLRSNLAWSVFLDLDSLPHLTLRERIAAAIRGAVRAGRLAPGAALPPSRALAAELGCSRWAVTEAYGQLATEGYLEARRGSATRVRAVTAPDAPLGPAPAALPGPVAPGPRLPMPALTRHDLTTGVPDLRAFPNRRWLDALHNAMVTGALTGLAHPGQAGDPGLRDLLADYLRRGRGVQAEAADILITNDLADGLSAACRMLRTAGVTALAVEDPGPPRLRRVAAAEGLDVVGIPVDAEGIRGDLLAAQPRVRAVLVTPLHQVPTGAVLSTARRSALLSWARDVGGFVLEDDSPPPFRYDARPAGSLQGLDPGRVMLLGSTSMTLAPGIGIGWLVRPRAWTCGPDSVGLARPSGLWQATLARFLEAGSYDRHLRTSRARYRRRRATLVRQLAASLPEARAEGAAAGLHFTVRLPPGVAEAALVRRLDRAGVSLTGLDFFRLREDPRHPALVVGFGNLPDAAVATVTERIAAAVRIGLENPGRSGPAAEQSPD